ncbi:S-adenosylmethionine:tRNA ribosyltransferase-isomerase [soil metagenome]
MNVTELDFGRPAQLQASAPPEARGLRRDEVRLLVSSGQGHHHATFRDLADYLTPGDLLIVNDSATLAASLPAEGSAGPFILNLSTDYVGGLWLAEPRWSPGQPGPLPLRAGDAFTAAGLCSRVVRAYPGLPRLLFVSLNGDVTAAMRRHGEPIRYGYLREAYPLEHYQTHFARLPGSAEMPSAARPFTLRVLASLRARGVRLATVTLHTGVSSLELSGDLGAQTLYPEPFAVPAATSEAVNTAKAEGRRVVAVGTTVVRALEASWNGRGVTARRGFTRLYLRPGREVRVVNCLLTGLHDPRASHLAMLCAVAGRAVIQEAYAEAVRAGYLWHEFGDSHLILP